MNVQPQRWLPQAALAAIALGVLVGWGWHAARPVAAVAGTVSWTHLSTISGELPSPNASKQQTALVVDDLNNDGLNDFVVATRRDPGPSLMWYERHADGWTRHVIDPTLLRIEAGGTSFDVDNDGDKDIVMGGDGSSNQIWWWENPLPQGDPTAHWTRRLIKNSGPRRHHDLVFADVDGDGAAELVFWNQRAQSVYMADIPADPRQTSPWLNMDTGENVVQVAQSPTQYYEGLATADIDLDGQTDLVSGGYWYKHNPDGTFTTYEVAPSENLRVAVGQLVPGGRPEIVLTPGDAVGMARWYQWDGASWIGHDLHDVKFAHSLEVGDVDGDGNLDVFIGEMKFAPSDVNHNPGALTWLHYGDGLGNFTTTIVATGVGQHESRLADLNGDGDLDILGKPFTADTPRLDIWLNSDVAPDPVCEPLGDWDRLVVGDSGTHRNVLVATADLDGDGRLDIVAGKYWYRNPGPGLPWDQNLVGGLFNQFATSGDFDGDGDIDLLGTVSNDPAADRTERGNAFVWARNDGTGTFSTLDNIQPGTGNFLQGVALGTFVPGATDIVLSWHANTTGLEVLRLPQDPAGELWTLSPLSTSAHQNEDLSQGDIDGDGDPDLLLGTQWLQNQGAGQWADNSLFTATRSPDRNELADINGDGRLDAVVGYEALNEPAVLAWYRAPADPSQPWPEVVIATIFGPMSVGAADMDGDGDADVVVGEHSTQDTTARRVLVYENTDGLGISWQQHLVYTGDEHHDGALPVDIDGDGDLDIISIGWTHGRVHLYQNGACAAAEPTATPTSPATPESTYTPTPTPTNTADVTPTPTSTATTTPEITDTPTPAPTNTAAGTETPSATSTDTPAATATPTMTPTATRSAICPAPRALDQWERHVIDANRPGQATYLFDVDVNGDRRTDLVTGQFWYENVDGNAGGVWTRHLIGAPLSDVIAAHDFDGDGDLDFLGTAGNTVYPNGVWAPFAWARNDGNGVLTVLGNIDGDMIMPVNDPVQGVAIAQFTPGGPTEIAITWDDTENPNRNANGIQVLTVPANPSAGTWARRTLSDFSLGEDLNAADLDEDGDLDLFLGKSWLRNNHPSAGWTPIEIFTLPAGYQASRQSLLDVDRDNDLDAIIGYSHSPEKQQVVWYEQQGSPFSPWIEHVILELTSSAPNGYAESLDVADMDGDGDSDVVVGEYRVNYNPPGSYPGKLWIVENIGDGDTWQPHLVYDGDSHYQSSQAADIDRDGDLDIISKGWLHNRVHVYENGACDAAPAEGTPTPTATPSATPSSTPTASHTSTPSPTPTASPTVSPSPTPPASGFGKLLISTSSNGAVDGIAYADEDILAFDMATNTWSLWFDGSDVGLGGVDLNALAEFEDGRLLLSFEGPASLPGLGKIDDSDIVLFTPESLGPDTAGTLAVFLVGSDYGLTRSSEGIDALTLTRDGGLLISTKGSMRSGTLRAQGQDLVRIQLSAAGRPTDNWTTAFIGSAASLSTGRENIGAVWQEDSTLYLVTYGNFAAGGLKGSSGDIFRCQMPTTGPANNCDYDPSLFWRGSLHGLGTNRIDALSLQR